jgi:3-methyl-2-oxobutanoate hydroxymethyltransferase
MLGITAGKAPSFAKNYMQENDTIQQALAAYVRDVKNKTFPDASHCFV